MNDLEQSKLQSLKMASQDAIFFEKRKQDHIRLAMDARTQTTGLAGFDQIVLAHEALSEINFSDIQLDTELLGVSVSSPLYISSMTAGHAEGEKINSRLAELSASKNILMGVGSQRKELSDSNAALEWKKVRAQSPRAKLLGNLGITQLIHSSVDEVERLVESLGALGLFIHLNPLQEVLQPEGTPQFKGSLAKIEELAKRLSVPLILKEVGCGISEKTAKKIIDAGVKWIDVAGMGGTHWGRIEGFRAEQTSPQAQAADVFKNWGISTAQSVLNVKSQANKEARADVRVWASGGIRSGLDAAKAIALGAEAVGIAQPFLQGALESDLALERVFSQFEYELKIALFCMNFDNFKSYKSAVHTKQEWSWT